MERIRKTNLTVVALVSALTAAGAIVILTGRQLSPQEITLAVAGIFITLGAVTRWKLLLMCFIVTSFFVDNPRLHHMLSQTIASNLRWFFFSLLFLHASFRWLLRREDTRLSPPEWWFLVFSMYCIISVSYSIRPLVTLLRAGTLIMLWVIVFLFAKQEFIEDEREGEWVFFLPLLVLFLSLAIGGVMQLAGQWNIFMQGNLLRLRGLSYNPNQFGMICNLAVPSALYLSATRKGAFFKGVVALTLLFTAMSGARSAMLGVFVSMVVFLISTGRAYRYLPHLMLAFSVGVASIVLSPRVSRVTETLLTKKGGEVTFATSVEESRIQLWRYGIKFFLKRPFLGHGHGTGPYTWAKYYEPRMNVLNVSEVKGPYFENIYVEVLVTLGLVGMFIFMVMLGSLFFHCWNLVKRETEELRRDRSAAYLAILCGSLVYSFFMSWLLSVGGYISVLFWLVMASALAWGVQKKGVLHEKK